MKLYASVGAWQIHFIFFLFASICKITAASDDLAPCVYVAHRFGTHPVGTGIGKDKFISLFQSKPAVPRLSRCRGQFKLPIFGTPFPHIENLQWYNSIKSNLSVNLSESAVLFKAFRLFCVQVLSIFSLLPITNRNKKIYLSACKNVFGG